MGSTTKLLRLLAVLAAMAMLVAACGSSDDGGGSSTSGDEASAEESAAEEPAEEEPAAEPADDGAMADDSMDAVKIGLIAQDEELLSFPEVRSAAQAFVDYANAELGGIDGHPVELDVCGAGDAPEGHVACAQQFVNDDSVHIVLSGGFLGNSAAVAAITSEAGKAMITLGNDFVDYFTPNSYVFDPGLPGLAQVFFVFASQERDIETMTLFIADDPAFEPFIPVLELIAETNGIAINEVIPLGFEPDLTGPISAANTDNESWIFVLGDGAQCGAASAGVETIGYDGQLFANDLCMSEDVVSSGALNGWSGPVVSSAPTTDGKDVAEIARILDTYGDSNAQLAGLSGWALANTQIAYDVLGLAGGAEATDASVIDVLNGYSNDDLLGYPPVACPGPSAWTGACNQSPLMVDVVDGAMTAPGGFTTLDFSELDFLLEG